MLAPVVEEQSFGAALALVVARALSDRIGVSPIGLVLGVNFRVAIDFTGRRLKNFCPQTFCKPQQIDRAMYTGLGCLDGIVLIVHRRGWAGQIVDFVHLYIERKSHVVAHDLETRIVHQMGDIVFDAREVIVHAQHVIAVVQQPFTQMGTDKSGTAGDQDLLWSRDDILILTVLLHALIRDEAITEPVPKEPF